MPNWWWKQNGVDVEGMWKVAWEVEQMEEDEDTDGAKEETD